jgi:hypothetical protein
MTNERREELELLLFDWEAGTLDDAGVERVRQILRSDESARTYFLQQQTLSAALKMEAESHLGVPPSSENQQSVANLPRVGETISTISLPRYSAQKLRWIAAFAAAILICIQAGRILYLERAGSIQSATVADGDAAEEATSHGVALVTQLVDIKWDERQTPLEIGDAVAPGRFAIESGYAQVEFFCGATVIVEGPAELDLKSATRASVRSGRLRAQVPPAARGFSLEVDDLTVVDLGTEFGLSVSAEGANVQVFDGEVELQQTSNENRLLTAGQSVIRSPEGTYTRTAATPDSFLNIATLESRAQKQQNQRYKHWQAWSRELRSDPRLIVYYAFDQSDEWQRRLSSSLEPANTELDGAIVGANQVSGRWPAKRGLEFKRPGDRVRVQIPGQFGSLTLTAWAKIDSLDRRFNSLFLTDNYNAGEPHWQILETGQLYFSVKPTDAGAPGPRDYKALSPSFWKLSLSGRWIHLAVVYNMESRTITHFVNGNVLSEDIVPPQQVVPTQIGAASIGNWSSPTMSDAGFAVRNLNGSIDEFAMYAAALSADEIRAAFENGKP